MKIPLKEIVVYTDWDLECSREEVEDNVKISCVTVRAEKMEERVRTLGNLQRFYLEEAEV